MKELTAPYEKFAYPYDRMMANVNYVRWATYIEDLFKQYKAAPRKILEVACGTGALTVLMEERGYEMCGLDRAEGMLAVARQKAEERCLDIPFIRGDMRDFNLQGSSTRYFASTIVSTMRLMKPNLRRFSGRFQSIWSRPGC